MLPRVELLTLSNRYEDVPGGPVVKNLPFPMQGRQVQFLVGELRCHMPVEQLSLYMAPTEPLGSRAQAPQQEKLGRRY